MRRPYIITIILTMLTLAGCSAPREIITHDTIHYVNEHFNTIYDSVFVEHKNKEKTSNDTVFIYDTSIFHHYHSTHDTVHNDTTIYIREETVKDDPQMRQEIRRTKTTNTIILITIAVLLTYLACKRLKILR